MLDENLTRFPGPTANSDAILAFLTARQHLQPHQSVHQVMELTTEQFGCCPNAIARAIEWLKIDGGSAIGRLRRSELVQLARALHRFWSQSTGAASTASR